MNILAIDPGNILSGWCVIEAETLRPQSFDKSYNGDLLERLNTVDLVVIERVASYGMPVGKEVFQTCEWVGRFTQRAEDMGLPVEYVYRREEKLYICGDSRAKDANIRQALIDRFAQHDLKTGKGTKKDPDWFYGFKSDIWQSYAVGLTCIETKLA